MDDLRVGSGCRQDINDTTYYDNVVNSRLPHSCDHRAMIAMTSRHGNVL